MINWEAVGISAAIALIFVIIAFIVLRKRINDVSRQLNADLETERDNRINGECGIRSYVYEVENKSLHDNSELRKRIDELDKAINDEQKLRIKRNAEILDSVDQQFKQISFQSGRIDILTDRTNDLDKKFNDVLIAKSVEHPETFRSRAAEGRCVFCGKKVDPVFIMPLMINTKALTYANGQELYTCEECYKKFDQFIAGRRA